MAKSRASVRQRAFDSIKAHGARSSGGRGKGKGKGKGKGMGKGKGKGRGKRKNANKSLGREASIPKSKRASTSSKHTTRAPSAGAGAG